MLKGKGGDRVPAGFYWNAREWEAQVVPREGAVLNGGGETMYVRLPLWALLVLAPLMGAAFAMFLPFIGFAMVLMYLAGRLRRMFSTTPPAAEQVARPEAAIPAGTKGSVEVHGRKAA
jgi:hypothetical protein